jgi:flavodoxin
MKRLVVYYSRTGNNRAIGNAIAQALNADVDEIIDMKNRKGMLNWLRAGRDSMGGKLTEVEFEKDPQEYDTIIIGAPIWASNPIPPLRTYLQSVDLKGKRVAFYICSQSKENHGEMFYQLRAMTPDSEHIGTFSINEKHFKEGGYEDELEQFIAKVKEP